MGGKERESKAERKKESMAPSLLFLVLVLVFFVLQPHPPPRLGSPLARVSPSLVWLTLPPPHFSLLLPQLTLTALTHAMRNIVVFSGNT